MGLSPLRLASAHRVKFQRRKRGAGQKAGGTRPVSRRQASKLSASPRICDGVKGLSKYPSAPRARASANVTERSSAVSMTTNGNGPSPARLSAAQSSSPAGLPPRRMSSSTRSGLNSRKHACASLRLPAKASSEVVSSRIRRSIMRASGSSSTTSICSGAKMSLTSEIRCPAIVMLPFI